MASLDETSPALVDDLAEDRQSGGVPSGPGTPPPSKAAKKRAAKRRAAERKRSAAGAGSEADAPPPALDEATMAAMIGVAKRNMEKVEGESESGEEKVKLALQALQMVTGILREQKGSEEGVLDALREAAARDRDQKDREAARKILRDKVRARTARA